ncbi:MAG TPA: tetratricopeptide repeat protein [Polyangia bacterium]|nr:tetratricopeptide repeat protein [Polyangia bacterium]
MALAALASRASAADDATAQARSHYEMGLKLFDARENEQALIEFRAADDLKPRPAALFMMAQCEYLLGRLKDARAHYARYASENPDGEFVELAKDRIQSIDKRPSTFVINTVPDDVTVHIRAEGTPSVAIDVTGQAPNNFQVPRGRYRIDVTRANYQGQTRVVDVDIAETKPLFFKLDPIPARLEIETVPPLATLYVNGNRARNPYRQDVPPGHVEIFAEAPDHDDKTIDFTLTPGEQKRLLGPDSLRLNYAQRSGRPELIVASSVMGALVGAGAVAAAIGQDLQDPGVASVLLVTGGGISGAIAGALIAQPLVRYIPDNRALYIMGDLWMGAVEGFAAGTIWEQIDAYHGTVLSPCPGPHPCRPTLGVQLRDGFVGSLPGLALGLTTGVLTADHAPTYGRATLIQSAALGGLITGALVQLTLKWQPYGDGWERTVRPPAGTDDIKNNDGVIGSGGQQSCLDAFTMAKDPSMAPPCAFKETSILDLMPGALIGLNVGLAAGLLGAYLPDQSKYGPSWKRVLLIDLGVGAGMVAGGVAGCVANTDDCLKKNPTSNARAISAGAALAGGAIGFVGGWMLTRHVDDEGAPSSPVVSTLQLMPMPTPGGGPFPGLAAMATF